MATTPFLTVNGVAWPCPMHGFTYTWATVVNAGRNANGAVIGQVVGRQIIKFECTWAGLMANEWHSIMESLDDFYVPVTFYDVRDNRKKTLICYPGDRSATPLFLNSSKRPYQYESCKVNLVDCGL